MIRSSRMSSPSSLTQSPFDGARQSLRNSVLTMASIAQRNLEHVCRGLLERDTELCTQAIGEDDEVDELERRVDWEGMQIIVRFAPKAQALREVLGSMKIATNLERVSDQAVNIGRRARKVNRSAEVAAVKSLEPTFELASDLLKKSVRAFSEGDVALALEVVHADNSLDKQHDRLIKNLTKTMEVDTENLRTYMHLVFVVRFLERVGDHAVNIAEDTIFIQRGDDIRHRDEPTVAIAV